MHYQLQASGLFWWINWQASARRAWSGMHLQTKLGSPDFPTKWEHLSKHRRILHSNPLSITVSPFKAYLQQSLSIFDAYTRISWKLTAWQDAAEAEVGSCRTCCFVSSVPYIQSQSMASA